MIRTPIDSLITEKSLSFLAQQRDSYTRDQATDEKLPNNSFSNVCARVPNELSHEIDTICDILGIIKRRFLEAAFVDAVEKAHRIMGREGVWDAIKTETDAAGGEVN